MNIKQSSAALKSVDGFLKSRGVHLGAVSTLELVELMVVALATQPPQDERGQGRIPFAGHDPKFCPGSNPDNPQTEEDAEPAQPVNQGDEMNSNISEDYDRIDRYLRNNLGDDDYASYSASLDAVLAEGAQPTAQPMPKNWIESPTLDWLRKVLTRNDDNVSSASAEQIVNMIDHYAAASWNAAPPPHVDPDWENRNTESLSGWINELATLADHPQVREIWIRQAMGVIVRGLNRFAEPAPPVALSTLTDELAISHIIAAKEDSPAGKWLYDFAKAIEHRAASAPAQQATPPQPVAADVAIAPKLLLERAAEMCEWYAEFIRDNVMSQDIERHPYLPELEGVAVDLRALAGTGSDESKEGEA